MEEENLRNVLSSISHLAMHGDIPVHAFGTIISAARGELIAEHLHQRWLSDPNFAKIAANIVFQLHGVENKNITVCSQVLALALRDFKSRRKIRKRSRHMFRNYLRTLIALYPVYREMDKYLSACLIDPMFRCLQILVDDSPDDSDLRCVANTIISSGQMLYGLNPVECDRCVIKCRKWLMSNGLHLEEATKFLLLNAFDLWTYSWNVQAFPHSLQRFYEEYERAARNDGAATTAQAAHRKKLMRQPSVMDARCTLAATDVRNNDDDNDGGDVDERMTAMGDDGVHPQQRRFGDASTQRPTSLILGGAEDEGARTGTEVNASPVAGVESDDYFLYCEKKESTV